MKVTEELRKEHETIKVFLKILETLSKKLSSGETVDPDSLNWMFEFSKYFIDRCHHGKEEKVLFQALICAGMPEDSINCLTSEHEVVMGISKVLRGAAAGYSQGELWAASELIDAAWRYASVMDEHIETEEGVFYSLADSCLTREMEQKIVGDYQKFELERIGPGRGEELKEILEHLKDFYL